MCSLEEARKDLDVEPLPASESRRISCYPTHLADAVDADVTADPALVARGTIHHGIPQLLCTGVFGGPAVQLTGVL